LRGQDEDYFLFHLQTQGDCQIIQDDRKIVIRPGEMAMYDTRRPYQVSLREEFRMRTVRIPVELLRLQLPHPERLVASPVLPQGFVGRFLARRSIVFSTNIKTYPKSKEVRLQKQLWKWWH
jgi:hypothetical protein